MLWDRSALMLKIIQLLVKTELDSHIAIHFIMYYQWQESSSLLFISAYFFLGNLKPRIHFFGRFFSKWIHLLTEKRECGRYQNVALVHNTVRHWTKPGCYNTVYWSKLWMRVFKFLSDKTSLQTWLKPRANLFSVMYKMYK